LKGKLMMKHRGPRSVRCRTSLGERVYQRERQHARRGVGAGALRDPSAVAGPGLGALPAAIAGLIRRLGIGRPATTLDEQPVPVRLRDA